MGEPHEMRGRQTCQRAGRRLHALRMAAELKGLARQHGEALGPLDGVDDVSRRAFVKGWLFYRQTDTTDRREPSILNPRHLTGFWLRHGEESLPKSSAAARWSLLAKPHWLAPRICTEPDTLITQEQLEQLLNNHFASRQSPLLIARLEPNATGYHEVQRGFVVPPVWPHLSPTPKPLS